MRWIATLLIALTLFLLYPGLTKDCLTIRGVVDIEGAVAMLDTVTAAGMPPEQMALLRPMLNPAAVGHLDDAALSSFIGQAIRTIARGKLAGARLEGGADTVYVQTQNITVTIRYLFENGGYLAGTLLLLFSVCIPLVKAGFFLCAVHAGPVRRTQLLTFINVIGKWSMADVFLVAIYTAWLGARSSVGVGQPIHFETSYGPGFYWFAAYCVFSLAAQQVAVRLLREPAAAPQPG